MTASTPTSTPKCAPKFNDRQERLALPVVLAHWLLLLGGLAIYSAIRRDDASSSLPLWVGTVAGTALGQLLALRRVRLWVAVMVVGIVSLQGAIVLGWVMPATCLLAFVPGALCGYLSLSDRLGLVAFWFPSVLWMLSILDRSQAHAIGGGESALLLGGLALLFLFFLRVREARRVALWQHSGARAATETRHVVLREQTIGQLARTAWTLGLGVVTFAVTATVAPHLWQDENLGGSSLATGTGESLPSPGVELAGGLPCCPATPTEAPRQRVREYFDIGRGADEFVLPPPVPECVACPEEQPGAAPGPEEWLAPRAVRHVGVPTVPAPLEAAFAEGFHVQYDGPSSSGSYGHHGSYGSPYRYGRHVDDVPPSVRPAHPRPAYRDVPAQVTYEPAPRPAKVRMVAPPPTVTEKAMVDVQPLERPTAPPPAPPPVVAAPPPPPAPPVVVAPPPAPPAPAPAQVTATVKPMAPPPPKSGGDHQVLQWLLTLLAGGVLFQLLSVGLRPLRRLVTLRHLRRPYWRETVDQKVSNLWQLALIGLRDAGWRTYHGEQPQELARRVGASGLDACATILDRTRHGLAVDAQDLAEMEGAATAAYQSARSRMSTIARVVSWLRAPLV